MTETNDGLPVIDYAEVDIPLPDAGGLHESAMKAVLGEAGAREMVLASRVVMLEQAFAAQRRQIEALKAKVASASPEPAVADAPSHAPPPEPAAPYRLRTAEDLVGANGRARH